MLGHFFEFQMIFSVIGVFCKRLFESVGTVFKDSVLFFNYSWTEEKGYICELGKNDDKLEMKFGRILGQ